MVYLREEAAVAMGYTKQEMTLGCVSIVALTYCRIKYFWKKKKNEKNQAADAETGGSIKANAQPNSVTSSAINGGSALKSSGRKPPSLDLTHVNLAFDREYDVSPSNGGHVVGMQPGLTGNGHPGQPGNHGDVPHSSDSSVSSQNEWPNKSYSYEQSESERTSDSEFERHHMSNSSAEHSRKSIRFAPNLPTLSGDAPPADGRVKISRAKVTLVPPPAPRGKKPLPVIEVPKSQLRRKLSGNSSSGAFPRISMNPMPTGGRLVRKQSSTGSRSASASGSVRGTSPHRRSGRRTQSRSPQRSNSGRRSRSTDSNPRHPSDSTSHPRSHPRRDDRNSSLDSNTSLTLGADIAGVIPDLSRASVASADYTVGMHPGMAGAEGDGKANNGGANGFGGGAHTHLVAGNSGIQPSESQPMQRGSSQRRSRSHKRRPRGQSDSDSSLTRDIVAGNDAPNAVDSPPMLQMVAPGNASAALPKAASPLAQSSPQTQRRNKAAEQSAQKSFDSYSGEVRPRMPYDYFPPGSPGDALAPAGGAKRKNKTPRATVATGTSYQPVTYQRGGAQMPAQDNKLSDPDSNYYSGSSGDRMDSGMNSPSQGPGGVANGRRAPLVFQGVANTAYVSDETSPTGEQHSRSVAGSSEGGNKKRRRKSQNRGKNTSGGGSEVPAHSDVTRVHGNNSAQTANGPYRPQVHEYSNDSLIYMDYGTDTDKYAISSKKAVRKQAAMALQRSGETEL